jgi:hypothetical protein
MLNCPTFNVVLSYLKIHFFGGLFLHSYFSFLPTTYSFPSFLITHNSLAPSFYSALTVNSVNSGRLMLFQCRLKRAFCNALLLNKPTCPWYIILRAQIQTIVPKNILCNRPTLLSITLEHMTSAVRYCFLQMVKGWLRNRVRSLWTWIFIHICMLCITTILILSGSSNANPFWKPL